jgi:hypothetical protein
MKVRGVTGFGSTVKLEAQMAYHCPGCSRPILSRRNNLCSFCGAMLPANLLFAPAEIAAIEATERERALARELRAAERVEAKIRSGLYDHHGGCS